MRYARATALFLALVAPALPQDAPVEAPARDRGVTCVLEEECLASLSGTARREGANLVLSLDNGTTKVLADNREACADPGADGCAAYTLSAYLPASGVFVVGYEGHETGGVLVIETKDGSGFELASHPEFSPSGQRLVSVDRSDDGRSYDITAWSRYQGQWIDQLRYVAPAGSGEGWALPRWSGEDLVTCTLTDANGASAGVGRLVWDGQGWQIQKSPR